MNSVLALARPELLALEPYRHAAWLPSVTRLHANENPWADPDDPTGPPLNRYPEPLSEELRAALARLYGLAPAAVLPGRGSDEGIDLLVRAFCRAGQDRVLICPPTFGMYRVAAEIQGAGIVEVPLDAGFGLDAAAVRAACSPAVKLVFLCSPNNPTGNSLATSALAGLLDSLAGRAIVVVDEAYAEFAPGRGLLDRLPRYPELVLLRTLSKAHGLAGARCGAVLADPAIIELLARLIHPYALPSPTIDAALAALAPERLARSAARTGRIIAERERLAAALAGLGAVQRVWPSAANFLLVEFREAGAALAAALRAGLLLRDFSREPRLAGCIRITVGAPADNDRLLAALGELR
ncbi:MAG: histidinol-phosphate transaminase [Gammaproteobacteria bacterium]|nr:histidinol-phosphate transaminase [Gammaproteobacteria bacterium]